MSMLQDTEHALEIRWEHVKVDWIDVDQLFNLRGKIRRQGHEAGQNAVVKEIRILFTGKRSRPMPHRATKRPVVRKNSTTVTQHRPRCCTRGEVRSIRGAPPLDLIGRNNASRVGAARGDSMVESELFPQEEILRRERTIRSETENHKAE